MKVSGHKNKAPKCFFNLTLTVLVTTIDALQHFETGDSRGDGGSRVGEVRAGTTSPHARA